MTIEGAGNGDKDIFGGRDAYCGQSVSVKNVILDGHAMPKLFPVVCTENRIGCVDEISPLCTHIFDHGKPEVRHVGFHGIRDDNRNDLVVMFQKLQGLFIIFPDKITDDKDETSAFHQHGGFGKNAGEGVFPFVGIEPEGFEDQPWDVLFALDLWDVFHPGFVEKKKSHLVVVVECAHGENGHGLDGGVRFSASDRSESHGGGQIENDTDAQFAFFDKLLDKDAVLARACVPVDIAHVVAFHVRLAFAERHSAPLKCGMVRPDKRFLRLYARPELDVS